MQLFIPNHRVDVWKTLVIAPGDRLIINEVKAPVTIEIKNLSEEKINLISKLRMPKSIISQCEFTYRLPKKAGFIIENRNTVPVSIHLHYYSSKSIFINNKEVR